MMYRCPMCGKKMNSDTVVYIDHVEAEIAGLIKKDHPDWAEDNGTCPKCYEYYKKQLKG